MKKNTLIISALAIALFAVFASIGHANPMRFPPGVSTASASTTLSLMTAGTATTTLTYDSYVGGQTTGADKATLLAQFTASSTSSTLKVNFEYSQDGVDWYQNALDSRVSTTSTQIDVAPVSQFSWKFASSTPGLGAVSSSNNLDTRIVSIYVPTRFVRAIFTLPAGSANGGVWAQILPQKQQF